MLQLQSGADPGFSTGELNLKGRHLFVMDFYSGVRRNLSTDVYGDVAVRIFRYLLPPVKKISAYYLSFSFVGRSIGQFLQHPPPLSLDNHILRFHFILPPDNQR